MIRPIVADTTKSDLGNGPVVAASEQECTGASQTILLVISASIASITAGRALARCDNGVTVAVTEIFFIVLMNCYENFFVWTLHGQVIGHTSHDLNSLGRFCRPSSLVNLSDQRSASHGSRN